MSPPELPGGMIPDIPLADPGTPPTRPWITAQEWDGGEWVTVTFATPQLERHIVRVPFAAWLNGEHLAILNRPLPTISGG